MMDMILNENDLVVGASFENGTIQDYVDEANTYGLIRIEDTTVNWFLHNQDDASDEMQELYEKVTASENHYIKNDFGEEVVLFDKKGTVSFEDFIEKIDKYLDVELVNAL
ncbi:hypothetical protein [Arcobacter sp.]|uniref:hypothetical protein n=1 Tax=unclassified Arcobacter TaxID=2593671 RepID=UPI003B0085D4